MDSAPTPPLVASNPATGAELNPTDPAWPEHSVSTSSNPRLPLLRPEANNVTAFVSRSEPPPVLPWFLVVFYATECITFGIRVFDGGHR